MRHPPLKPLPKKMFTQYRMMKDDVNEGLMWRVWFGGDVQGLDSPLPDIVCLHSLRNKEARDASVSVMKDIQVREGPRFSLYSSGSSGTISRI
jgi:hypothetical protein